jgi:hypothetical protein
MNCKIMDIEQEINALKERNKRVETDKAWERSKVRIFSVAIITYIIAAGVMRVIGIESFWLNALIPSVGYILSTQSLPIIKKRWVNKYSIK